MHTKQPRPLWMLIFALTVFGALAFVTNSFPPTSNLLIGLVFVLSFVSCSLLFTFILNSLRRGVLLGSGVVVLLLRLLGLRSPLYGVLLLVVLASLELTWKKR